MNKLFIEAEKEATAECSFLKALIARHFPNADIEFVTMGGVANLFNESNLNQIRIAGDEADNVIVLLDADTEAKGWGYAKRHADVTNMMKKNNLSFPLFLYPNNHDDGDVEELMEAVVRKELHPRWWNCFDDYEKCVQGSVDAEGHQLYNIPNRKAKLHTFISSQRLSAKSRKRLGRGDWLFSDSQFWNLESPALRPLLDFLKEHVSSRPQ